MITLSLPLALVSPLRQASLGTGVFTLKHGRAYIKTGLGETSVVELGPGKGDLTISGIEAAALGGSVQTEAVVVEDRGNFLELVEGKQTYPTVSLNIVHRGVLTDATNRIAIDTLLNRGKVLAAVDTTVDPGGIVWTSDWYWIGTRAGVSARWDIGNVRGKLDSYTETAEGNTMAISGTAYGAVVPS